MTEDRISKKDSEKQVLIQKVKERLKWYTFEASEEEFDAGEVEALTELLMAMQGNAAGDFDVEDSWRRFPEHCRMREELERRGAVFADTSAPFADGGGEKNAEAAGPKRSDTGEEPPEKPAKGSTAGDMLRSFGRGRKGAVRIAACIFAGVVLLGGTGVYAEKGGGFFHWLNKDEKGIKFITSPQGNTVEKKVYDKKEDVPKEFYNMLWIPQATSHNWEFIKAYEMQVSNIIKIKSYYEKKDLHIEFEVNLYDDIVTIANQVFDGYTLIDTVKYKDIITYDIYEKVSDDETEYIISFFYGNMKYLIVSNVLKNEVIFIFEEYASLILEENL